MTPVTSVLSALVCLLLVTGCGSDRQARGAPGSSLCVQVDAALVVALPTVPDAATAGAPMLVTGTTSHANAITCEDHSTVHHHGGGVTLSGNAGQVGIALVGVVLVVGAIVLTSHLFDGTSGHDAQSRRPLHAPTYSLTLGSDTEPTAAFSLRNGQTLCVTDQTIAGIRAGSYNHMTLRTLGTSASQPVRLALAGRVLHVLPSLEPRP